MYLCSKFFKDVSEAEDVCNSILQIWKKSTISLQLKIIISLKKFKSKNIGNETKK